MTCRINKAKEIGIDEKAGKIRTADILNLSRDLPVVIDVVDTEERIMAIVPEVEAMVEHGLVTVQKGQMEQKGKK
jgi:PII-like signaling protein